MKPSDRSLEIVAVGLGQAGGNIAAEFQQRGYRALAFNTAQTDLSSLGTSRTALPDAQRIYVGLAGCDGAGSDADYGRECIAAHVDAIRSAVAEHASGADVVVLCAGLGGGTGSCAAQFAAAIADLALPIVIVTTLPHSYESGIAKVNALRGVRDLANTPSHGWVLIDNARLSRLHRDAPIDTYFETINREIVEPFDLFNRLNERESLQAIRTLDGEDFRSLLLSGGVVSHGTRVLPKLEAASVLDVVRASLGDNPMMPADSKLDDVSFLGLVIEASESALASSPFSLYEEIAHQLKRETGGAAVYVGLYRQLGVDDTRTTVRMIASSHALPGAIGEMLAEAEREAGAIQQKLDQSVPSLDLTALDRLRLSRRPIQRGGRAAPAAAPEAQRSEGDPSSRSPQARMVKVPARPTPDVARAAVGSSEPAASPAAGTKPTPGADSEAKPAPTRAEAPPLRARTTPGNRAPVTAAVSPVETAPRTTKVDELRRMVASAPATAATTPATAADPSRGRYERLANAFADANSDEKRLFIARELVAAQRSGEALERFYAVNAMVRVDPHYFRDALANAAKDADPHVADLARRALEKIANAR